VSETEEGDSACVDTRVRCPTPRPPLAPPPPPPIKKCKQQLFKKTRENKKWGRWEHARTESGGASPGVWDGYMFLHLSCEMREEKGREDGGLSAASGGVRVHRGGGVQEGGVRVHRRGVCA
jgi:hypothetical protein